MLLGSTNLHVKARPRSPTPHIISETLQNDPVQSFDQRSEAKQNPGLRVGLTYPPGLQVPSAIYDDASNWQCRPARDTSPLFKALPFADIVHVEVALGMSWHWSQAVWDCPKKEEINKTTHTPFQQDIILGDKSPLSQH